MKYAFIHILQMRSLIEKGKRRNTKFVLVGYLIVISWDQQMFGPSNILNYMFNISILFPHVNFSLRLLGSRDY